MGNGVFAIGVEPGKRKNTHHEFSVTVDFHEPITQEQARMWLHNALAKAAVEDFKIDDTTLEPKALLRLKQKPEACRWIPVTERLPEDGYYLATLDGELVNQKEPFTGMCGIENGKWDDEGCVIAWMPLPEPY